MIFKKTKEKAETFFFAPFQRQERPYNVQTYFEEGYKQNVVVYRCVREITRAMSQIDCDIYNGADYDDVHPSNQFLKLANPRTTWQSFLQRMVTDYLLAGNAYCIAVKGTQGPLELWHIPAQAVSVVSGKRGFPQEYKIYGGEKGERVFPVDQVTGQCDLFHWADYDPTMINIGMGAMRPAALAADVHNNGLKWNASLLGNGAKPSGILRMKDRPSAEAEQGLREWFTDNYSGSANAGRPAILTGEAEYIHLGHTPQDMDYLNAMKEMAKYIASSFGVPLPLIDNDSATFNNIEQAKERFYTDTVLPLLDDFLSSFGLWLFPMYGPQGKGLSIKYDRDSIPALEGLQTKQTARLSQEVAGGMISIDEAREAKGYEPFGGIASKPLVSAGLIPLDMIGELSETPAQTAARMLAAGYTPDEIFEATGERV